MKEIIEEYADVAVCVLGILSGGILLVFSDRIFGELMQKVIFSCLG